MFSVEMKKIHEKPMYYIPSKKPDGSHFLFLEWDEPISENVIKTLMGLGVSGILIKTEQGHHFISQASVFSFEQTLSIQRQLGADPKWVEWNGLRGFSVLRVSIKYPNEKYLKVQPYLLTDKELRREYRRTIKKYFYQGEPYLVDSKKEFCF